MYRCCGRPTLPWLADSTSSSPTSRNRSRWGRTVLGCRSRTSAMSEVDAGGEVEVELALTIAGCPLRTQLRGDVEARVGGLPGVGSVTVRMAEMTAEERSRVMSRARWKARERPSATEIPASARVVAVA